ncbi:hypothetical protein [Peribacillus glennii]|nr:hypothetical protein [Peribacillus glennii]
MEKQITMSYTEYQLIEQAIKKGEQASLISTELEESFLAVLSYFKTSS